MQMMENFKNGEPGIHGIPDPPNSGMPVFIESGKGMNSNVFLRSDHLPIKSPA